MEGDDGEGVNECEIDGEFRRGAEILLIQPVMLIQT